MHMQKVILYTYILSYLGRTRGINLGLSNRLQPYLEYVREDSGYTARMCRLV